LSGIADSGKSRAVEPAEARGGAIDATPASEACGATRAREASRSAWPDPVPLPKAPT
jgi:hypothetical protein